VLAVIAFGLAMTKIRYTSAFIATSKTPWSVRLLGRLNQNMRAFQKNAFTRGSAHHVRWQKSRRNQMAYKRRIQTRHHICPRSRCSKRIDPDLNNVVVLDEKFHQYWHYLFENLTVEEAIEMIKQVMIPDERWTYTDLRQLRNKIRRTK
jgi:hypothetical protein